MGKKPSAETLLRTEKRLRRSLEQRIDHLTTKALQLSSAAESYRARATKAEQEAAEWRRRFDELLKVAAVAENKEEVSRG